MTLACPIKSSVSATDTDPRIIAASAAPILNRSWITPWFLVMLLHIDRLVGPQTHSRPQILAASPTAARAAVMPSTMSAAIELGSWKRCKARVPAAPVPYLLRFYYPSADLSRNVIQVSDSLPSALDLPADSADDRDSRG